MVGFDIIFGGLTGLIGTALGQIFKYKTEKI